MLILFIRTLILYIVVVASLRFMGKRQLGQLQPSEVVIAMMISEVATIPMENVDTPLLYGVIPTITLIIAEAAFSFLILRSKKIRYLLSGSPTLLIEKGKVLEKEMEKMRFNIDDLLEELRGAGYANISDVEYAIIETNGLLSVIPKASKRPVTPEDLNINVEYEGLPLILISDGEMNYYALKRSGLSEKWLIDKLKEEYKIKQIKDVFIATVDAQNNLFVQKKIK
ncbi:MAG: DUF421 domain-containing protein [Ruminococcaceae bacterium]|nr:DUF421 domain-containing protein [Oscillospiraceae bacterium]